MQTMQRYVWKETYSKDEPSADLIYLYVTQRPLGQEGLGLGIAQGANGA